MWLDVFVISLTTVNHRLTECAGGMGLFENIGEAMIEGRRLEGIGTAAALPL
jgi:hypothetical protein